jgi:drug/metabolite transporter (DMT)-like permease
MPENNPRLGITLMIATTFVFAVQDGVSRHLAGEYNVYMVVMIRYWFFALFVVAWAKMQHGSVRKVAVTRQPILQITRALLLIAEICVMVLGFVYLGLIESYAIFITYPLIIAALSGVILGENVGWRRWAAICVGFMGVLVILQPGFRVFSPYALFPLASALMFALYGLLTRYAARKDSAETSFFWTGIIGAVGMTVVGMFHWQSMTASDWGWMGFLSVMGALGHFLLIKCYAVTEASTVQPFAYMQLVFGGTLGWLIFNDSLRWGTAIGGAIVIAAGLFTLWRERATKS